MWLTLLHISIELSRNLGSEQVRSCLEPFLSVNYSWLQLVTTIIFECNQKVWDGGYIILSYCLKFARKKNNIYKYVLFFCKIPMLLSLIRPILGHPLSMKNTGFILLRQRHLWDLMSKLVTELLSYIVTVQLFLILDLDGLF